jgi:hypothetical protein
MTIKNTIINKVKKIYGKNQTVILILTTMLVCGFVTHTLIGVKDEYKETKQKWETLKKKSKNHMLLVSKYKQCREGERPTKKGGSVNSCLIVTVTHGDMHSVPKDEIQEIYKNIISTRESINRIFKNED